MASLPRRKLLQSIGIATAAVVSRQRPATSQDRPRLSAAVIGVGGMGLAHVKQLAARDDLELTCVCDVDATRLADAVKEVEKISGRAPRAVSDLRRVLDDASIEAVWIATPDHWHAPAAILALEAGKHVYVEKPCSHNVREGRLLVDAVARSGRHLQVGTQSRSSPVVREAIERIGRGEIGTVLIAKAWNSQRRGTIGRAAASEPPATLDFDLWCGPAAKVPYRSNLLPGSWRWFHDFGCGDMGNDGVHDIDVALWGLGVTNHPSRVSGLGSKLFFDDDQQFPDSQYVIFDYPAEQSGQARQLIFEQRIWSPYVQEGYENGVAFYGTEGVLLLGHNVGWKLFGPRNQLLAERTGRPDIADHHQDFIDCLQGMGDRPHADAEVGHRAATVVHLGNIACRLGRSFVFDPRAESAPHDAEADGLLRRAYRAGHWAIPRGA